MSRTKGNGLDQSISSYILCNLLSDVPISEDSESSNVYITCVEFWNGNLYIGTSAAEILHYVLIPADSSEPVKKPDFILASRLHPDFDQNVQVTKNGPGVQQILVLPSVGKACIRCNATLSFYALPELTPAFGGSVKLPKCSWVGGVDLDDQEQDADPEGVVVMVCVDERIRMVRIGEKAKSVRTIEVPGCLATLRRGNIACVADRTSYSLLDVAERQKIPLFDVSSTDTQAPQSPIQQQSQNNGLAEASHTSSVQPETSETNEAGEIPAPTSPTGVGPGTKQADQSQEGQALPRSASLNPSQAPDAPYKHSADSEQASAQMTEHPADSSHPPPRTDPSPDRPASKEAQTTSKDARLHPHIVSPTSTEFLLTTGTSASEAGVGVFVNMDGDVVRGTIQFDRYPESIAVDGKGVDSSDPIAPGKSTDKGYVLAVTSRDVNGSISKGIEIQRWDVDSGENAASQWLEVPITNPSKSPHTAAAKMGDAPIGLRGSVSAEDVPLIDAVDKLRLRLAPIQSKSSHEKASLSVDDISRREKAEADFASQLSHTQSKLLVWRRRSIWWAAKSPVLLKLDARLDGAESQRPERGGKFLDRAEVEQVLNELRGSEPQTELEFLSFKYIRQKASLMLFLDLINATGSELRTSDRDLSLTIEALIDGEVDPRVILALIPTLSEEIVQSTSGIWLQGGLQRVLQDRVISLRSTDDSQLQSPLARAIMPLVKQYLSFWRRKKGFGSVADEKEIFASVDAALLHLLLMLDAQTPRGPAQRGSIRSELGILVDGGVDCFERATELLEQYKRPYMLSRLYQSKRDFAKVLETWRRIVEGTPDNGGEFEDGEEKIRKYLGERRDKDLIEEYGTWLAARNPKVGVSVFIDPKSQVKFDPRTAAEILKAKAPNAVKEYLEQLVFGNNLPQYANDLVGYYLDSVLAELETSQQSREALLSSYEAYRALRPPKPTYSQFATDNAPNTEWWNNRLRLLQLLGGSHGAASQYDLSGILQRIQPHKQELVPETIILSGREGRHEDALNSLTHGLGDFDTAVRYCVLGGSSTYSHISGRQRQDVMPSHEEQMGLFQYLLEQFLCIQDLDDRITQTSELLERFAGWFDINHVLESLPNTWSVEIISGFLENTLRKLVSERNGSAVTRALTSSENLTANAKLLEKIDAAGPTLS